MHCAGMCGDIVAAVVGQSASNARPWLGVSCRRIPRRKRLRSACSGAGCRAGLVYTVLFTALLSGSALNGAFLMLAFGLGTLPNLLAAAVLLQRSRSLLASRTARVFAGATVMAFGSGLIPGDCSALNRILLIWVKTMHTLCPTMAQRTPRVGSPVSFACQHLRIGRMNAS